MRVSSLIWMLTVSCVFCYFALSWALRVFESAAPEASTQTIAKTFESISSREFRGVWKQGLEEKGTSPSFKSEHGLVTLSFSRIGQGQAQLALSRRKRAGASPRYSMILQLFDGYITNTNSYTISVKLPSLTTWQDSFVEKHKMDFVSMEKKVGECEFLVSFRMAREFFKQSGRIADLSFAIDVSSESPECRTSLSMTLRYDLNQFERQLASYLAIALLLAVFDLVIVLQFISQISRFPHLCLQDSVTFWTGLGMFNCLFCFLNVYFSTVSLDHVFGFFIVAVLNFVTFSAIVLRILHKIGKSHLGEVMRISENAPHEIRKYVLAFYLRIYTVLLLGLLNGVQSFPSKSIMIFAPLLFFNQIYSVASKNSRVFPRKTIQFALCCSKLVFFSYFKFNDQNFLKIQKDNIFVPLSFALFLIGYFAHVLQIKIGPRWFIPRNLRSFAVEHNYFVSSDDPQAPKDSDSCPICYVEFAAQFDWKYEEGDLESQLFELNPSSNVMKTPCLHFFHSTCLITHMNYKMTCPLCRTELPPLLF